MEHIVLHLTTSDPVLAPVIEQVGLPNISYRDPTFATMARSIVFQQLSGKAARTIYDRLVAAAGGALSPEALLKLRTPTLRRVGLSQQKAAYVRDLAKRTLAGEIDFPSLPQMSDEDVIEHLTRVKGIGVWSAQMFLLFALRRENVLPTGDLGVQAAIRNLYRKRALPKPKHVERIGRPWHPYCSFAAWYLWRSLEKPAAPALGDCKPQQ